MKGNPAFATQQGKRTRELEERPDDPVNNSEQKSLKLSSNRPGENSPQSNEECHRRIRTSTRQRIYRCEKGKIAGGAGEGKIVHPSTELLGRGEGKKVNRFVGDKPDTFGCLGLKDSGETGAIVGGREYDQRGNKIKRRNA